MFSSVATTVPADDEARLELERLAAGADLDVRGGVIRRSSSRFCLGVEHGDYNGTELFGVGTDRFIWMAFKANETGRVRLFSGNFPGDGVAIPIASTPPSSRSVCRMRG